MLIKIILYDIMLPLQKLWMRLTPLSVSLVCVVILWMIACFIHKDILLSMIDIWWSHKAFQHCFFVVPAFIFCLYHKWGKIKYAVPHFEPFAFIVILFFGFVAVLAHHIGINLIAHAAFIILLQSCFVVCIGRHLSKVLMIPIAVLFFMVPFGTEFIVPLQNFTADISVWLLKHSGVNVSYKGIYVYTDRINFYVAEACAGLRFLVANLFVMALYGFFTFKTRRSWLIFVPVCFVVPILGNCLRAYMIMMIGYYSNGKYATGVDHLVYGWGFFTVLAILNFMIGEKLYKLEKKRGDTHKDIDNSPDKHEGLLPIDCRKHFPATIFALFTALGLFYHIDRMGQLVLPKTHAQIHAVLPVSFTGISENKAWKKIKVDPFYFKQYDHGFGYFNPKNNVMIGVLHYNSQNSVKDVSSSQNKFYDEEKWLLLGRKSFMFDGIEWNAELSGLAGHYQAITLYSYYTGLERPEYQASSFSMKKALFYDLLYRGQTQGGVIYIRTYVDKQMSIDEATLYVQRQLKKSLSQKLDNVP